MTKDEMRAGLLKAYELLAYGVPDPDLTNSVSAPKWREECEEWLDKFPPSKLPKPDEPRADGPHQWERFDETFRVQPIAQCKRCGDLAFVAPYPHGACSGLNRRAE